MLEHISLNCKLQAHKKPHPKGTCGLNCVRGQMPGKAV